MIRRLQQGFSLLEMSVVLVIVAMLLAAGVTMSGSIMQAADMVRTQQRVLTIQSALDSYAKANGYLPCPASLTQTTTANPSTFGVETRSGGTACSSGGIFTIGTSAYIGMVPVRTLGLPDAYAGDAWQNKIFYAVSYVHVGNVQSYATTDGKLTVKTGDLGGTFYPVTSLATTTTKPNTPAKFTYGAGATYVVVSLGKTGVGDYPMKMTNQYTSCDSTTADSENCDLSNAVFWDTAFSDNQNLAAQFFDDIIAWGSNTQQRNSIALPTAPFISSCSGACESWCAPCGGTVPYLPSTVPTVNPGLCGKIITSTSPCEATCILRGSYASNKIVRCP